jgi:hypothetical protein
MSENKDFTYSITDSSKTITGIVDYTMIQRLDVENTKHITRAVDSVHKTSQFLNLRLLQKSIDNGKPTRMVNGIIRHFITTT